MNKKTASAIMLTLLFIGMLTLAFNIQPVKASGTIYIRADGSVDPPTAPISSVDNVTYTFTSNVNDSIAVEKNNTVIDGAGYTLQGGGSARGIELFYVSNVTVKNVRIENWVGEGIFTGYASDSMILGNNITNNSVGIYLAISSNNTISGNNIASDFVGIFLAYSSGNVMSKNTIKNNDLGIEFSGSSNNIISKNIITSNNWGFYLRDGSSDNKIYHNNLINNINQAYPPEDSNVWNDGYPSGGNYWSDYNGTDFYSGPFQNETDSDGIGDSPYIIDENNTDRYPLIHSYGFVPFVPSPRTPQFWLLAIEKADQKDGQFLISELLKYPNWNNSTEYTAYIHLLSQYTSEEIDDPIRPYLCGYPSRSNVELEIKNFLAQASSGDIVIFYIECHGWWDTLWDPRISYSALANWLSSGGLQYAFVTVILETCNSGSSIKDGEGGVLGPNRNVLCTCMSGEGGSGLGGMWQGFSHFITEGFALCGDSDNDGWASAAEVFEYAKPLTEDWIEATFGWGQHPVSYYGQVEGNVPLVQRDVTKPFPDIMPPTITLLSPQNVTYTTTSIPLTFTVDEATSWISYSLDNQANVTITGNTTLTDLSEGTHYITVYANDTSGNMGASETVYFTISLPYGPKAKFTVTPETAKVGELVKFDASNSLSGWNGTHNMPITEYRWDFGDGNRTTTSTPIIHHRFSHSGIYYVTLTVYAPGATPETDSTTSRVTVITIPVGGYSIPIQVQTKAEPIIPYIALIATLTAILTKLRPKTKRKHRQ
jgi:parallel beta-helix repeat protein